MGYYSQRKLIPQDGRGVTKPSRGVRQGCPFSAAIFTVAMAGPLRRITQMVKCRLQAHLDDVATIVPNITEMAKLGKVLETIQRAVGLVVNFSKTAIMPVEGSWLRRGYDKVCGQVKAEALGWARAYIARCYKCVGVPTAQPKRVGTRHGAHLCPHSRRSDIPTSA